MSNTVNPIGGISNLPVIQPGSTVKPEDKIVDKKAEYFSEELLYYGMKNIKQEDVDNLYSSTEKQFREVLDYGVDRDENGNQHIICFISKEPDELSPECKNSIPSNFQGYKVELLNWCKKMDQTMLDETSSVFLEILAREGIKDITKEDIEDLISKQQLIPELRSGSGISADEQGCFIVLYSCSPLSKIPPEELQVLPKEIKGYRVKVKEMGIPKAQ